MSKKSTSGRRQRAKSALPEEFLEAAARRFKALAVPSRLRILNALMQGPCGMGELAELTELEQSNVSRQVSELERAGCVARIKQGRSVQVEIADPELRELCDLVCNGLKRDAKRAARPRSAKRA